MSLNICYNLFIIRSFRLLCTVVSLFYVCVVNRHVRIARTCDMLVVVDFVFISYVNKSSVYDIRPKKKYQEIL